MRVRAGVGFMGWPFSGKDRSFLWDFVDMCEASVVDSIWVSDRVVGPGMGLESMSLLAAMAGRTKRLKFGNSVLALPLRNPTVLAKEIATIDFISGRRMLPAVGLGGDNPAEYEACGVDMRQRAGRTDEAIVLMRKLWTEDSVTFHGRYFNCTNVHIEPRTIFKPCPPIWIGGRSDAAFKRAGRLGDGFLGSSMTPGEVGRAVSAIRDYAKAANRVVQDDHYGVLVPYCFADSRDRGIERVAAQLVRVRPDVEPKDLLAVGSAEEIIRRIAEYVASGATKFVLRPACPPEETLSQTERLAREVIPTLHQMTI